MFKNNWRRQRGSSSQTHSWRSKFFHLLITFKLCALVFYPVYRLQKLYFRISENPLFLNKDLTLAFLFLWPLAWFSNRCHCGPPSLLAFYFSSLASPFSPWFLETALAPLGRSHFWTFIIHSLVKDQLLPPRFRSTRTSYSSFGYHPSLPIPSFPLSSNPSNHANSPPYPMSWCYLMLWC